MACNGYCLSSTGSCQAHPKEVGVMQNQDSMTPQNPRFRDITVTHCVERPHMNRMVLK